MSGAGQVVSCPQCSARNRVPAAAPGVPTCGGCHARLPWQAEAGEADFGQVAEAATVPVLVDLWAPWCGPCRRVSPALERLAWELAGRLKLVKVNVDEAPAIAARYGVQAVPTLLMLRNGREVARQTGAPPGAALRDWVDRSVTSAAEPS